MTRTPRAISLRMSRLCVIAMLVLAAGVSFSVSEQPVEFAAGTRAAPGAEPYAPDLQSRLDAALAARGEGYVPRTKHLEPGGTPKYTNRLILESSPYLLQHAHNPVDWYPWGDEAFETARKLGRPVLLSIGYSTCHWCHVMEEESFEDEEIAAFLNAHYVAVKVDREERPDVDSIYMSAVQMLTGRGGWPMTTWLNPDREPFYGGTYFPARDGDRGTRKGFLTLLKELQSYYVLQPEEVVERSAALRKRILASMNPEGGGTLPGTPAIDAAMSGYVAGFDGTHGGMRGAPKFPSSLPVRLLLRRHARSGDAKPLEMATLTLSKMAGGGMYDQVGGGFHRYSTDVRWLVPHFEKMLYDNALLTVAYLEGYQATGREEYAEVARDILRYVGREMTDPGGAFYSATDADSLTPEGERDEGYFFTWTPDEIDAVAGETDGALYRAYFNVSAAGNFEGRTIPHVTRTPEQVAAQFEISVPELERRLTTVRAKLYETRSKRPAPLLDDKILTSWNGLMISAFARAGFVLKDPDAISRARSAADFVLTRMRSDGRLRRSYKDGKARFNAYLDDYAFLIAGLLDLYEASFEVRWLEEAVALQKVLEAHYADKSAGGYFMTSDDHEKLLARERPAYDGAEPSGNSVAVMNLLRLHELTTDDRYRESAERAIRGFSKVLTSRPRALAQMLMALDFRLGSPKEVVVVKKRPGDDAEALLKVLRTTYLPDKVVVLTSEGKELEKLVPTVPLVKGKVARKGKPTAYVCERGVCQLPTSDPEVLAEQLRKRPTS